MQNIEYYQNLIETHIRNHPFQGKPGELYDPVNYLMSLGGKRMRPVLLLMAADFYGKRPSEVLDAALAIEVFHNFTLAHDDIMDEASIRRGKQTMHAKYGINTAILGGDIMLIKAYELLLKSVSPEISNHILQIFSKTAVEICEGQQIDMNFEQLHDPGLDEYIEMIRLKTAVLLGAAMQIGALIGGAPDHEAKAFYDFAVNLGVAFQIKDDHLDTYGDGHLVGKRIGGDILRKKKTFLWLKCREFAAKEELYIMDHLDFENESERISAIISIYDKYAVKELSEQAQEEWYRRALDSLSGVSESANKELLYKFAQMLMNRMY